MATSKKIMPAASRREANFDDAYKNNPNDRTYSELHIQRDLAQIAIIELVQKPVIDFEAITEIKNHINSIYLELNGTWPESTGSAFLRPRNIK